MVSATVLEFYHTTVNTNTNSLSEDNENICKELFGSKFHGTAVKEGYQAAVSSWPRKTTAYTLIHFQ